MKREKAIMRMENFVNATIPQFDQAKLSRAEQDFIVWKDYPDKHDVTQYYNNPHFCFVYTRGLYRSRIECFNAVLVDITSNGKIKQLMMENCDVTSFGCGPGPEIAAYWAFMRDHCAMNDKLRFNAVDKISHWKSFIDSTNEHTKNMSINFTVGLLSETYLQKNNGLRGICIMSYPEAVNFGNVWTSLTELFKLIIIVDQSKSFLHNQLSRSGFTIKPFIYKGNKDYAYHMKEEVVPQYNRMSVQSPNRNVPTYKGTEWPDLNQNSTDPNAMSSYIGKEKPLYSRIVAPSTNQIVKPSYNGNEKPLYRQTTSPSTYRNVVPSYGNEWSHSSQPQLRRDSTPPVESPNNSEGFLSSMFNKCTIS